MKCELFITFAIFLLQGIDSKSLPSVPGTGCSITEASQINGKYLGEIYSLCEEAVTSVRDRIEEFKDEPGKLEQELSEQSKQKLDDLHLDVTQSLEQAQKYGLLQVSSCLNLLDAHVNTAKAKTNYDLYSCSTNGKEKVLELTTKDLAEIEKKIDNLRVKSTKSLGKCAMKFGPYSVEACPALIMCSEGVKLKLEQSLPSQTAKIDRKLIEALQKQEKCYLDVSRFADNTAALIQFHVVRCNLLEPLPQTTTASSPSGNDDHTETTEDGNQSGNSNQNGNGDKPSENGGETGENGVGQTHPEGGNQSETGQQPGGEGNSNQGGNGGTNGNEQGQGNEQTSPEGNNQSETGQQPGVGGQDGTGNGAANGNEQSQTEGGNQSNGGQQTGGEGQAEEHTGNGNGQSVDQNGEQTGQSEGGNQPDKVHQQPTEKSEAGQAPPADGNTEAGSAPPTDSNQSEGEQQRPAKEFETEQQQGAANQEPKQLQADQQPLADNSESEDQASVDSSEVGKTGAVDSNNSNPAEQPQAEGTDAGQTAPAETNQPGAEQEQPSEADAAQTNV